MFSSCSCSEVFAGAEEKPKKARGIRREVREKGEVWMEVEVEGGWSGSVEKREGVVLVSSMVRRRKKKRLKE